MQTKGILGAMTTSACSPASMKAGLSIFTSPVFLPIFHLISWRRHGAFAVRTWMVGVKPPSHCFLPSLYFDARSWPGWSCTNTSAVNSFTWRGMVDGSSLLLYMTSPTLGSLLTSLGKFFTLMPTLSPVDATSTDLWCISIVHAFPDTPPGANSTTSFGESAPCLIRPVITVPTPLILYTPDTGIRKGLLVSRLGGLTTLSNTSYRVRPVNFSFLTLHDHPLYQGISFLASSLPLSVRLTP